MEPKTCKYPHCEKPVKKTTKNNAKYCKEHALIAKQEQWRLSKQLKRKTKPENTLAYQATMNKSFPNQPRLDQNINNEQIVELLLQIRKTNNAILKKLTKKKK